MSNLFGPDLGVYVKQEIDKHILNTDVKLHLKKGGCVFNQLASKSMLITVMNHFAIDVHPKET